MEPAGASFKRTGMDQFVGLAVETRMTALRPDVLPLKVFALTLGLLGLTLGARALASGPAAAAVGVVGFAVVSVLCLISVGYGLRTVFGARPLPTGLAALTLLGPVVGGAVMSFGGAFLALWSLRPSNSSG